MRKVILAKLCNNILPIKQNMNSIKTRAISRLLASCKTCSKIELQLGGRLVGIISHVAELKERIKAQLIVTPSEKGSKARNNSAGRFRDVD